MEPKKTGRRIVSKGRYIFIKSLAVCLSGGIFACMVGILLLLANVAYTYGDGDLFVLYYGAALRTCKIFVPLLVFSAFLLRLGSRNSWQTVHTINPLTRANTADLPAPDSLVRASSEPMQAQEAVLLRAAAEGQETPPEQLVRPARGAK